MWRLGSQTSIWAVGVAWVCMWVWVWLWACGRVCGRVGVCGRERRSEEKTKSPSQDVRRRQQSIPNTDSRTHLIGCFQIFWSLDFALDLVPLFFCFDAFDDHRKRTPPSRMGLWLLQAATSGRFYRWWSSVGRSGVYHRRLLSSLRCFTLSS